MATMPRTSTTRSYFNHVGPSKEDEGGKREDHFAFHSPPQLHYRIPRHIYCHPKKVITHQVSSKPHIFSHLLNQLHLLCLRGCDFDPTLQSQKIHLKLLANTPSPHSLDGILDLSSIHLPLRQFLHVFLRDSWLSSILREARQKFLPEKKTG